MLQGSLLVVRYPLSWHLKCLQTAKMNQRTIFRNKIKQIDDLIDTEKRKDVAEAANKVKVAV